ncbi:MAG: hypothetical protein ACK5HY_11145, partial [Parahaliea sp.]
MLGFGNQYALEYRFPESGKNGPDSDILRGTVEEFDFSCGVQVVRSDVQVLASYESRTLEPAPLCIIVVLAGQVTLRLGD